MTLLPNNPNLRGAIGVLIFLLFIVVIAFGITAAAKIQTIILWCLLFILIIIGSVFVFIGMKDTLR